MKRIVITLFFASLAYASSAQKVEKFCEISTTWKSFNRGVNISIDFGKDSSLFSFKDKTIKKKLLLVTKYTSVVDALNYMSALGWSLVNTTSYESSGSTYRNNFYFKKAFDEAEINNKNPED
ncbi:hypothetical protein FC093_08105 [Ilyomonas limi]|uniref:Uncharacterized protein n=1 Tax=Ilyomonas limi TaxID=2575867 RepID=A0A4U3L314_9BACT|nr:hypothetical protein [Ilyomonas limi]TKK69272.1 hypothetical protein FC093_08105 [Ilyomonas limi]